MSSQSVYKICGVIDFDGFYVNGDFLVREFGFVPIVPEWWNGRSKRYDLRPYFRDITNKDFGAIRYVEKNIFGLPFRPLKGERVYSLDDLDDHIVDFYDSCKSRRRKILAYKGGEVEKDKLDDLGIPNVNLEIYGCPRYDDLHCSRYDRISCGYHRSNLHCPRAEVTAFKDWIYQDY